MDENSKQMLRKASRAMSNADAPLPRCVQEFLRLVPHASNDELVKELERIGRSPRLAREEVERQRNAAARIAAGADGDLSDIEREAYHLTYAINQLLGEDALFEYYGECESYHNLLIAVDRVRDALTEKFGNRPELG